MDRLDLHVPVTYWGDAVYFQAWVKGVMEGNWPWNNPHLGMPFGADWRDFPVNLAVEGLIARILAIFTSSSGLTLNLLWISGTAATAGTAAYCLQRLRADRWVAAALGVIYALQPFTFARGVGHFNLLFYLVPLLATGAIEMAVLRTWGSQRDEPPLRGSFRLVRSLPAYLSIGCVLQGLSYIYNAFFGVVLFGVASLLSYSVSRRRSALLAGSFAIFLTGSAVLVNLAPTLFYWAKQGPNPAMHYKSPAEADAYGLKLRYLFTPNTENPAPPLKYIQQRLDGAGFPADADNEASTSRLGSVGSAGLLFIFAWVLTSCLRGSSGHDTFRDVLGASSALAIACVLLATVGGFGSIFNVFVSPDIRCYNRIVVFLDYFAIAAIAVLLTKACVWCERKHVPRALVFGGLGLLVVFGISDQAVTAAYRAKEPREGEFRTDDLFVKYIQSLLPANAMIFELPFTGFPPDGVRFHMLPYDQGKPYLHSSTLRWSWGGIDGREEGDWWQQTSKLPPKALLRRVVDAGFSGIWVDRFGYEAGTSPEREIGGVLGQQPLLRQDGRIAVYDIRDYAAELKANQSHGVRQGEEQFPQASVEVTYPAGFYGEEHDDKHVWNWSSQHGVIRLRNTLSQARAVRVRMTLQTGSTKAEPIAISAGGPSEKVAVTILGTRYTRMIQLGPLQNVDVSLDCQCSPIRTPGDSRAIYFGVINLSVGE